MTKPKTTGGTGCLALLAGVAVLGLLFVSSADAKPKGCTGYTCAGQPSTANGRPRVKPVRPYVRRDGTLVQGTFRSKPAKK